MLSDGFDHCPPSIGIGLAIQRIDWREDSLSLRVDQIHTSQVPACIANRDVHEVSVTGWNLETLAFYRDRAVASALTPGKLLAKGLTQSLAGRAPTQHVWRDFESLNG